MYRRARRPARRAYAVAVVHPRKKSSKTSKKNIRSLVPPRKKTSKKSVPCLVPPR